MFFESFLNTIEKYLNILEDAKEVSALVNKKFRDRLQANHIENATVLSPIPRLIVDVIGKLKPVQEELEFVSFYDSFFMVDVYRLKNSGKSHKDIAELLKKSVKQYLFEGDGKYVWIIPDGFMASLTEVEKEREESGDGYFSHESVCVINTSDYNTRCKLEVFYEENPEENNFECEFEVRAKQSLHYRLDKLKDESRNPLIKKDLPVSYKITSLDARIVVQGSRILTSGKDSEFASFGTVMGW